MAKRFKYHQQKNKDSNIIRKEALKCNKNNSFKSQEHKKIELNFSLKITFSSKRADVK